MGFFKSLRQLNKQAKEIDRNAGPMDQRMAGALASMQQANALMAQQTAAFQAAADPAAVTGSAQILASRDTGMRMNLDPTLQLDLLVTLPGQPPYPATVTATVSMAHLGRVQPGGVVTVRVDPATPAAVHLDWMVPVQP
jgi:membrane protease subunit (stomatin/prohibitin family)